MKRIRKFRDDRGSALLVSLMVIVGLSMLGLGFVAISETENSIAANNAGALQTEAVAETGARAVVEWFQNPDWAIAQGFLPANNTTDTPTLNQIKIKRVFTSASVDYNNYYKPDSAKKLLDKPFRPNNDDRFFGCEDSPDLTLNRTNAQSQIDKLNAALFGTNPEDRTSGEITEILIYAPPIVGGTLTADPTDATGKRKFWVGGNRYGVATIKVTAQKFSDPKNRKGVISQHSVRITVGEFPLPIPAGPIQGNANVSLGGNFDVHWGMQIAQTNLDPSNHNASVSALPWANAYERSHFEHGYEFTKAGSAAQVYPTVTGSAYDGQNYFNELLGKSFEDPWFGTRAGNDNKLDSVSTYGINPMCYGYDYTSDEVDDHNFSFQWQNVNVYPLQKRVVFPTIKYAFWKKVALQGRGQVGIYYFKYGKDSGGTIGFLKGGSGSAKPMAYWVNTQAGAKLGAGFYFFDTNDGSDPQGLSAAARDAKLTPAESWNSSDMNKSFLMIGFIYVNALKWGTTGGGQGPTTIKAAMPGEVFRDIGYQPWDTSTGDWQKNGSGALVSRVGGGDGTFSYQDLNGNGKFDLVVTGSGNYNYNDPGTIAHSGEYRPKTWAAKAQANGIYAQDCTVPSSSYDGTNASATDCSEPHEPFLNFIYPSTNSGTVKVGWEAQGSQTYRAKKIGVTCPDKTTPLNCTSNGYDVDGALVDLDVILEGILYNEGGFDAQGNCMVFGSLLINADASSTGTADVWFDESLLKGTWAPPGMPRVLISSVQTDETN